MWMILSYGDVSNRYYNFILSFHGAALFSSHADKEKIKMILKKIVCSKYSTIQKIKVFNFLSKY